MPAEAKAMLAQPITITGTMSASENPLAVDASLTASFAGQNLPLGIKVTGGKAWIQFMGQWYEAPAELTAAMSTATTDSKTTADSMLQALKAAGFDPSTWITGLKLVGEDDLDGTKAYHLTGNVDMTKVVSDAVKMSQDKTLQSAIPGMGALGSTGSSIPMPSGQELQALQTQISSMFQTFTVDVWVTKDGYQLRKAAVNAKIVPPAGEDAQGINDITLTMTFSVTPSEAPVTVTPPTGAKPFSELEQALSGLAGLFSGMTGGSAAGSEATVTTAP
jgi:hypothetical protein